jgi:predicted  nucleic acid-binding Zn-ribbon protein
LLLLCNNQGAGEIPKAVSQHVSEIDLATSNLFMLAANAPSGAENQTSAGLSSQASKLEASVEKLNSKLSAIGHEHGARLQSLASSNTLDIKKAKQRLASLSASLVGLSATN